MKFVAWMNSLAGRVLRVAAGAVLIVAGVLTGGATAVVLGIIGVVFVAVGVTGVCLAAPLLRTSLRAH